MSIVVVLYIIAALHFLIAIGREADAVWHEEKLQPVGQKPINSFFYDTYLMVHNVTIEHLLLCQLHCDRDVRSIELLDVFYYY